MNAQTEMKYRIAVDRQEIGEFDVDFITEMVQSGQIVTENAHYLDVGTKRWIPLEELVEPLPRQQQPVIRANAVRNGPLPSNKTRCVYIVLGFFFGGFGVHNFYAGRNRAGLMQVVLTGIIWVLMFVETSVKDSVFNFAPLILLTLVCVWTLLEILTIKRDGQGRVMK
jgi:hypothetical protein